MSVVCRHAALHRKDQGVRILESRGVPAPVLTGREGWLQSADPGPVSLCSCCLKTCFRVLLPVSASLKLLSGLQDWPVCSDSRKGRGWLPLVHKSSQGPSTWVSAFLKVCAVWPTFFEWNAVPHSSGVWL